MTIRVCLSRMLLGTMLLLSLGQARAYELNAMLGFGEVGGQSSRYRPDTWTPFTVYLSGEGATGSAQLQVTLTVDQRSQTYVRRISLHEGNNDEAHHFVLNVQSSNMFAAMRGANASGPMISVQLLQEGRKLADKQIALPSPVASETFNVLSLTRDGSGLNFLTKKKLGLVHRFSNPASLPMPNGTLQGGGSAASLPRGGINPNASLQVLYTDPRALPGMAQGYEMIDAIALGDFPVETLTEEQTEALKAYVREGGLLIVSGGGDLARLKSAFFADLLPIRPNTVSTTSLSTLASRYRSPLPSTIMPQVSGTSVAGASILLSENGKAIVLSRPYGMGSVVLTTFDSLSPEMRGWSGEIAFWRDLLRTGPHFVSAKQVVRTHASNSRNNMSQNSNSDFALVDALAGKQARSAPPWQTLAIFLSFYLILLIPCNYFLLKKLDRRELTWITVPILVFGFTGVSYAMANRIKGGILTLNRAIVVETQSESDQAAGYGVMALYSPSRGKYDIGIHPVGGSEGQFAPGTAFDEAGNSSLMVEHDRGAVMRDTPVPLWDKRSFEAPFSLSLGGKVVVKTRRLSANKVIQQTRKGQKISYSIPTYEVTVTNNTRFSLHDCALSGSQDTQQLGDLAPGASKSVTYTVSDPGGANAISMPPPANIGGSESVDNAESPDMLRRQIRNGLANAVSQAGNNYNYYGMSVMDSYGRRGDMVSGWFTEPLLDLQVDRKPAAGEGMNLMVVHVPFPQKAPERFRRENNPFVNSPILDLEENVPPVQRPKGALK